MSAATELVGPVLHATDSARAVVDAIRALNEEVTVIDRGAYWRVQAKGRCVVTRAEIEKRTHTKFEFPSDLERVLVSFQGRFLVDDEQASWTAFAEGRP